MNRQRAKFPWDLYWENETCKLKRSIPRERICNGLFFLSNYACTCKTAVPENSFFKIIFRISPKNKNIGNIKTDFLAFKAVFGFRFYCKSQIRILKPKPDFSISALVSQLGIT